MTRLVVCCDGTWGTPDRKDRGVAAPTNVVRLYNALVEDGGQRRYYHPGVGAEGSWWEKAIAAGTGVGLERNIQSAYRWLCDNYSPGDDVYLFGFSRGAYTVRSLVGFINLCGLLDGRARQPGDVWETIELLFREGYRAGIDQRAAWRGKGWQFLDSAHERLPIRFVGVWDTVGALGIPDAMALLNLLDDPRKHRFHNTSLSRNIRTARHAVAMDELRQSFQPTLWTNTAEHPDCLQKWFPGVHADVGGGYYEAGLANGALQWMLEEAQQAGLALQPSMLAQVTPNYHDMMHDSCTGPFSLLATQPRSVPSLLREELFHESALRRHREPPIHQCPYRQPHFAPDGSTIQVYAQQQWNATGLWLEAGRTYRFSAHGEWLDGSVRCGPTGAEVGHRQIGELRHLAGQALGKLEDWLRTTTGNPGADIAFTRRHEDMPWFCLVGCIANGGESDRPGEARAHEVFAVGRGCDYMPRRSGYFYAYANDAWNCYGNNRGVIELTVTSPAPH